MSHTQESIATELKRIQSLVPKNIRERIVKKAEMTPTIRKIAHEALQSGSTKQETKDKLKNLIESGQLDKPKYVEDPKYAKMANEIIQREIKKSIRLGKLPKKVNNNI